VQLCSSLSILWHCLSLGLKWKLTFSSLVATADFFNCWYIEWSIFSASSFRTWNSSTGIPSPLLALFTVMLPNWFRILGCLALGDWSHHCDYLGHEGFFLYSSSMYSCHLYLISSASVRSIPFLSFIVLIFAWNVPLVSLILLKRSLVFPILSSIYVLLVVQSLSHVQLFATPWTVHTSLPCHSLPPIRSTYNHFIFWVTVDSVMFLVSASMFSLLVYRNIVDFYISTQIIMFSAEISFFLIFMTSVSSSCLITLELPALQWMSGERTYLPYFQW